MVHVASLVVLSLLFQRDQLLALLWTKVWFVVPFLSPVKLSFAVKSIVYLCLNNRQVIAFIGVIVLLSLRSQSMLALPIVHMLFLFQVFVLLQGVQLLSESLLCDLVDAAQARGESLVSLVIVEGTEALGLLLLHEVRVAAGAVLLGDLLSLQRFPDQVAQLF